MECGLIVKQCIVIENKTEEKIRFVLKINNAFHLIIVNAKNKMGFYLDRSNINKGFYISWLSGKQTHRLNLKLTDCIKPKYIRANDKNKANEIEGLKLEL